MLGGRGWSLWKPRRRTRGFQRLQPLPRAKLSETVYCSSFPPTLDNPLRRVITITISGRGAVWLARLNGVQEVAGSNPVAPTYRKARWNNRFRRAFLLD